MKKIVLINLLVIGWTICFAATPIDMQAHIGSDEAKKAYTGYKSKQQNYYQNTTLTGEGNELFLALNTLMGKTCKLVIRSLNYNSLRDQYKTVDKDLNTTGYIIGYYDGSSMNGTWDNGTTYNREHTWPQAKGAQSSTTMGSDMHSVRPAASALNSGRGDDAYGESSGYYDPNEIAMNNTAYRSENMGSYRGDAARVILYDYLVYGKRDTIKNSLYNGNAQLLSKLGKNGVFESLYVMIKWHMQDPPSLTEMVRNDGAQNYQGNRNPFIDYPDVALRILKSDITSKGGKVYDVSVSGSYTTTPSYTYTLAEGFICYLADSKGKRPAENDIKVTGATSTYDSTLGRLTISNVKGAVTITTPSTDLYEIRQYPTAHKQLNNGQIIIEKDGVRYNIIGQRL